MLSEYEKLCEDFEKEQWFFIDKSMSEDRKKYWESKFREFPELKRMLQETKKLTAEFENVGDYEIDDQKFQQTIIIVTKKTLLEKVRMVFHSMFSVESDSPQSLIPKIAFGTVLVVLSFILIFTSEKQNPIKYIENEILLWDDQSFSESVKNVNSTLSYDKTQEYQEYFEYKFATDEWFRAFTTLQSKVNRLRKEINSMSLY